MKIVFFGSSDFSLRSLEACLASGHETVLVVTTPPKKKGRGLHLEPTVVRLAAEKHGLPVEEFPHLRSSMASEKLKKLAPDIFVAASYGKIIPPELLSLPQYRLNVHPSLIPLYRGAAPVNWPILNGDKETGVSIIDIAEKMDAGDIFYQTRYPIHPAMNAVELLHELAKLSAEALAAVFEMIHKGALRGIAQDEAKVSFARKLTKEDGLISFEESADLIARKIRGLSPWPGAYFFFGQERVMLLAAAPAEASGTAKPGTVLSVEKEGSVLIAAGGGALRIHRLKPEGKNVMMASDFVNGRRLRVGETLA
ncbi:MAG: Methionyl-tRNA formyltransferase [Candidatus Omnitrophica bacterium ADurb.Bin277]|nr:MAG: Methionyl-tRNA formyltransferase [Candidatus Omnitrophica bacterium ADurb.Bin277]